MQQKIIQIGNSTGIILPKALLQKLGAKEGMQLTIQESPYDDSLIISKSGKKSTSSISPRFMEILEKVNRNYGAALAEIAQK